MKKLILPLLLFLGITMLMAVESAPSAVVGYVKYQCLEGLNVIALPMNQGYTQASQVGIAMASDAVSRFDATLQDWVTAYDDGTGSWADDFTVGNGSVLMFYAYSPTDFYSIGSMYSNNASYSLLEGLNTAMVPLDRSTFTDASLVGISLGSDAVSRFDAGLQDWVTAYDDGTGSWADNFTVGIGSPFMAYSYTAQTWPSTRANGPAFNHNSIRNK